MRDRAILHIDMNAFYASVAQHLDPSLRGKAVAVAGDPERRSGIILAKSRQAKAAGVKTAEAIWQAKQKCPDLIVVPPGLRLLQALLQARSPSLLRVHQPGGALRAGRVMD